MLSFSSRIESHRRKEWNKEKSWIVILLISEHHVERKVYVSIGKEQQEHPLLFSRELAQIEDLDIQASTARQVLEQKNPKLLASWKEKLFLNPREN